MKRQLSQEEKNITQKQLQRITREIEYQKYLAQYTQLMISTGLWQNYQKQLREHQEKHRDTNQNILELQKQTQLLQEQINEGVEKKKNG